jgi:hypothetical protein
MLACCNAASVFVAGENDCPLGLMPWKFEANRGAKDFVSRKTRSPIIVNGKMTIFMVNL